MSGPLQGVRIVDLTQVVLGPFATQMMGDMGADVIKVETIDGDITRSIGPRRNQGMASMFLCCNRNKRSISLNLKTKRAKAALLKLVESADVFIHSMRPQAIDRLGLSYSELVKVNPKLIYAACYGYYRHGPYGDRPAYDDIIQGLTGLASLQEAITDELLYFPSIICDKTTALSVVSGISMALFHRERTGEGQEIEVTMFEIMTAFTMVEHLYGKTFEPCLGNTGYERLLSPTRRPYKTKDSNIVLLPYTDRHWREIFSIMNRPDLENNETYKTIDGRNANSAGLYAELVEIMLTRTTLEWLEVLSATNIPHTHINTLDDLLSDPHLEATGFWKIIEHPTEGTLRMPGIVPNFSQTPGSIRFCSPQLGESTVELLKEVGVTEIEINKLLLSNSAYQHESKVSNESVKEPMPQI